MIYILAVILIPLLIQAIIDQKYEKDSYHFDYTKEYKEYCETLKKNDGK